MHSYVSKCKLDSIWVEQKYTATLTKHEIIYYLNEKSFVIDEKKIVWISCTHSHSHMFIFKKQ
jgi:hypothetical protein